MQRLAVVLILLAFACQTQVNEVSEQDKIEPEVVTNSKIVIYQMMTRLFGNTNTTNKTFGSIEENGVGKLNDITPEALSALKDLGISHVWYTGVLEHATMTDYSDYGIRKDHPEIVKGRAGSPYAIKDYYDINPDLAVDVDDRLNEFRALLDRTHTEGLKAVIDFVPNHVSREYYSDKKPQGVDDFGSADDNTVAFSAANNFYYMPGQALKIPEGYRPFGGEEAYPYTYEEKPAKVSGNDVFSAEPQIWDWYETVKLNYGVDIQGGESYFEPVPDTWNKMYDILKYWTEFGVDGFRCDMAQMVPVEFWGWVIPKIQQVNPDIVFIAEIYDRKLYDPYIEVGRFDYLYDKVQLYDTLKHIVQGKSSTDFIGLVENDLIEISGNMLRFLENHDEQRVASRDFAGSAEKGWPAMVVSSTIGRGPVMIYFGQEVGEPGSGNEGFQNEDGRTTIFDYWGVPEHQKWINNGAFDGGGLSPEQRNLREKYSILLNYTRGNELLAGGSFFDLNPINRQENGNYSDRISAFLRTGKDSQIIVVANFQEHEASTNITIPADQLPADVDAEMVFEDLFSNEEFTLKDGIISVTIPSSGALILQNKR